MLGSGSISEGVRSEVGCKLPRLPPPLRGDANVHFSGSANGFVFRVLYFTHSQSILLIIFVLIWQIINIIQIILFITAFYSKREGERCARNLKTTLALASASVEAEW